jgi:hypothetical protein
MALCLVAAANVDPSGDQMPGERRERFFFDIDIALPIVGPVIHYRGWLDLAR